MDKNTEERGLLLLTKKDNEPILEYFEELFKDRMKEWLNVTGVPAIHQHQGRVKELDSILTNIKLARKRYER